MSKDVFQILAEYRAIKTFLTVRDLQFRANRIGIFLASGYIQPKTQEISLGFSPWNLFPIYTEKGILQRVYNLNTYTNLFIDQTTTPAIHVLNWSKQLESDRIRKQLEDRVRGKGSIKVGPG